MPSVNPEKIPPVLTAEPMVDVLVGDLLVPIPQHVLSAGLSHLRLATEAHVRLDDFAEGVGLVLLALVNRGIVSLRV